eukprot:TRINITY_DN1769_c0_g2_i3.p2 TRINITY_DN1769_c0_g2~~TRINITY_DN1769_c0_g2_i3.p2  ORF type:complete len:180 (-),score=37.36 TRINITY_DN1769_c0_g2_i3:173-712(-)
MKAIRTFFADQDDKFGGVVQKQNYEEGKAEQSSRAARERTERHSVVQQQSVAQQQSVVRNDRSLNGSDNQESPRSVVARTAVKRKSTMARKLCYTCVVQAMYELNSIAEYQVLKKGFDKYKIDDFKGLPKANLDNFLPLLKLRIVDDKKRYLLAFIHATDEKLYKYVMYFFELTLLGAL